MSLPWAMAPMPAAVAAAAPPLEPPGVRPASHGLRVAPWSALSVNQRIEKPGVLVRPITMPPARRSPATTGLSRVAIRSLKATTPLSVGCPATSTFTLMVTGTPWSGPTAWPRARAWSAAAASASADSCSGRTTALSAGLTASRRASAASMASRQETCRARIRAASSTASRRQSSVAMAAPRSARSRARRADPPRPPWPPPPGPRRSRRSCRRRARPGGRRSSAAGWRGPAARS